MPSGKEEPAVGLALEFAEYLKKALSHHGISGAALAKFMGRSSNYVAERLRGEKVFNVRDFENAAAALGTTPEELMVRVRLPEALDLPHRLVPAYEVVSRSGEKEIYVVTPADPQRRDNIADLEAKRRVRRPAQTERPESAVAKKKSKDRGETPPEV